MKLRFTELVLLLVMVAGTSGISELIFVLFSDMI